MSAISLNQGFGPSAFGLRSSDPRASIASTEPEDLFGESTETTQSPGAVQRATDSVTFSPEALAAANNVVDPDSQGNSETSENGISGAGGDSAGEDGEEDGPSIQDLSAPRGNDGEPLTEQELQQVEELEARDREVRAHEQAHLVAAGRFAQGGPTFTFEQGPDGRRYAVGGSVQIDTSLEATPEENLAKFQIVRRAALAPVEPSAQDRRVAALASQRISEARAEIAAQRQAELRGEDPAPGNAPGSTSENTSTSSTAATTTLGGANDAQAQSIGALLDTIA